MRIQTLEDYAEQRDAFLRVGPQINNDSWLFDHADNVATSDPTSKTNRSAIVHACELAYYMRDYERCTSILSQARALWSPYVDKGIARDLGSLDRIDAAIRLKLETQ